jgi:hypothetical protein
VQAASSPGRSRPIVSRWGIRAGFCGSWLSARWVDFA